MFLYYAKSSRLFLGLIQVAHSSNIEQWRSARQQEKSSSESSRRNTEQRCCESFQMHLFIQWIKALCRSCCRSILTLAFLSELRICWLGGLLIFTSTLLWNVEITQTGAKQSLPRGQKNEVVVKLLQAASLCSLLWSSNMYSMSRQIERTGKAAG